MASEGPENDVGCAVAHDEFKGKDEKSSGEDDEDPKLVRKWKKREYNWLWQQRYQLRQTQMCVKE